MKINTDSTIKKHKNKEGAEILFVYFVMIWMIIALQALGYFKHEDTEGVISVIYSCCLFMSYTLLYLLPAILLTNGIQTILRLPGVPRFLKAIKVQPTLLLWTTAVLLTSVTQILLYVDKTIYQMYHFHINGFVLNLIMTPGGMESMGGGGQTTLSYSLIIIGIVLGHCLAILASIYLVNKSQRTRPLAKKYRIAIFSLATVCWITQGAIYSVADIQGNVPVLSTSQRLPLYFPVTVKHLAQKLGVNIEDQPKMRMKSSGTGHLNYPKQTLIVENPQRWNIVWLVSESLRADMLNEEIMPATWDFSKRAIRCENHYSGGNGTRMGMFTLFYGLDGCYWFNFLNQRKGPVMIDYLMKQNYQFFIRTSAKFSYPEFDKTIFSAIPADQLHDSPAGKGWKLDRKNITELITQIDQRNPNQPFFAFQFFESPHARYYFPKESIIRENFLEEFNYATADYQKDIHLIKNRYINACHHLDSQLNRVLQYLKNNHLLESTLVIITGDHGEEFMEYGNWGHGSDFNLSQLQVPLILWFPEVTPTTIEKRTSHIDVVATILPLLGITNPASDYSCGINLLEQSCHDYLLAAHWKTLAYIDNDFIAELPLEGYSLLNNNVYDAYHIHRVEAARFYNSKKTQLLNMAKRLSEYRQ